MVASGNFLDQTPQIGSLSQELKSEERLPCRRGKWQAARDNAEDPGPGWGRAAAGAGGRWGAGGAAGGGGGGGVFQMPLKPIMSVSDALISVSGVILGT